MLEDKLGGIVAGFGKTEQNKVSEVLQQTSIRIISKKECRKLLPANTHYLMDDDSKFCGVGESSDSNVCEGDSGGGLYAGTNTVGGVVWYLQGIVSAAPRKDHASGVTTCDANLPAVYTNVEKYRDWIAAHEKVLDERNLLKDSTCGVVRNVDVASETAKPLFNQYPWNALLEFTHLKKNSLVLICSGVLIHRRRSVRLGEFDIRTRDDTDASAPHQTFRAFSIDIEEVILHPNINKPPYSNDLALLRLKYDVDTAKANIHPICLPSLEEYKEQSLTLTGWKRSKHIFPTLERDTMITSSASECQDQYGTLHLDLPSTDDIVCAGYNNRPKGKCHNYAAGSPLQYIKRVDGNYHYFLAGLMAFSLPNCRMNATEVFVKLNGATEWIKKTVLS
uniref:Peptidase S1 domain-containing protein n=1 Tax=Anopheles atroparvus TaxID=41427 RepID=A0A182JE90_ANOAO